MVDNLHGVRFSVSAHLSISEVASWILCRHDTMGLAIYCSPPSQFAHPQGSQPIAEELLARRRHLTKATRTRFKLPSSPQSCT